MSERRGGILSYSCSHPGCTERGCVGYDSQRERVELAQKRQNWLCLQHEHVKDVLGIDHPLRTHTMVITTRNGVQYWTDEDTSVLSSRIQQGPGFLAYAKHFPIGTKLVVTAQIELPLESHTGRMHYDPST